MNFFDIPRDLLPPDSQYYFNIFVVLIGVNLDTWEEITRGNEVEGLQHIWHIEQINDPEPKAICFYYNEKLNEDEDGVDFEMKLIPHQVVQIFNNSIRWYDMIDFSTEEPWMI